MEICKATIVRGDQKITFEGSSEFVQEQVDRFSETQERESSLSLGALSKEHPAQGLSEKQFVLQKKPQGHHEIATVLAFALTESGTKEFKEEDIRRAYIRADIRPPKHVSQALRDAKSKFDYITTGAKRGTYRLTNHGDRTVRFDLPRAIG